MAYDFVPNARRKVRAGRPDGIGLPSKGNARALASADRRSALLETDQFAFGAFGGDEFENRPGRFGTGLLGDRIPVATAIRPYRDSADDGPRKRPAPKAPRGMMICPGCGLAKSARNPRSCDCW